MQPNLSRCPTSGVLLIGHGTRNELGTRQFFQLGERLSEILQPLPVQSCLLEFQTPTIPEAWQSLVDGGVEHIHAAPLLLFAAGHAKQDIPDALKQCQQSSPQVTFDQCRPISRHPDLVDLVCQRINQTLTREQCRPDGNTALVMVGRGNRDPCAQADMRVLTEVVAHRFSFAEALTAFYAMAQPSLPDVLSELAGSGRYRSIIIHPHLLFEGKLSRAIGQQVQQVAVAHPKMQFALGDYLGPEQEIAKAIAGRIDALRETSRRTARA